MNGGLMCIVRLNNMKKPTKEKLNEYVVNELKKIENDLQNMKGNQIKTKNN